MRPLSNGRREGQRLAVEEDGDAGALLTEKEEHRLVVANAATGHIQERDRRAGLQGRLRDHDLAVIPRELARRALDRLELGARRVDVEPERIVGEAVREMAHDETEQRRVAAARADRAVEAPRGARRNAEARVDRASVVVGAGIGLEAFA